MCTPDSVSPMQRCSMRCHSARLIVVDHWGQRVVFCFFLTLENGEWRRLHTARNHGSCVWVRRFKGRFTNFHRLSEPQAEDGKGGTTPPATEAQSVQELYHQLQGWWRTGVSSKSSKRFGGCNMLPVQTGARRNPHLSLVRFFFPS